MRFESCLVRLVLELLPREATQSRRTSLQFLSRRLYGRQMHESDERELGSSSSFEMTIVVDRPCSNQLGSCDNGQLFSGITTHSQTFEDLHDSVDLCDLSRHSSHLMPSVVDHKRNVTSPVLISVILISIDCNKVLVLFSPIKHKFPTYLLVNLLNM